MTVKQIQRPQLRPLFLEYSVLIPGGAADSSPAIPGVRGQNAAEPESTRANTRHTEHTTAANAKQRHGDRRN